MSPQPVPSVEHRRHWYVNVVGLFDHAPSLAVSVEPTFAVPPIDGGVVFVGAAAAATPASANVAKPTAAVRRIRTFIGTTSLLRYRRGHRISGRNASQSHLLRSSYR